MKKSVWRWIGLGAAISLMLVYFIELTSNGLQRMDGQAQIQAAYEQSIEQNQIAMTPITSISNESIIMPKQAPTSLEEEIARLEAEVLALKKQALQKEKQQLEQLLLNNDVDRSNVNRLADSTSGALQQLSSSSMQFVAEMFHKVIN